MDTTKDSLIVKVLRNTANAFTKCELIEKIADINLKADLLLENLMAIQSDSQATQLIESVLLQHNAKEDLKESQSVQLAKWLHDIRIYAEISRHIPAPIVWSDIIKLSQDEPETILKHLVKSQQYDLTTEWLNIHPLSTQSHHIDKSTAIFSHAIHHINVADETKKLFHLIECSLPVHRVEQFYVDALQTVRSLSILKYLIRFLTNQTDTRLPNNYQKYEISLRILEQLPANEQNCLWNLIDAPLLIVEQYLMNTKFDTLTSILTAIRPILDRGQCDMCRTTMTRTTSNSDPNFKTSKTTGKTDVKHCCITNECVDALLRVYATKALDFRISESYSSTLLLYQSTDMVSLDSLCGTFVMPKQPIDRSTWTPDNEATHCQCCRRSVFTMLTRRHHCRQCGRVVCHACSTRRMPVPTLYADILVRVCEDCFRQTEALKVKLLRQKTDSPLRSPSPSSSATAKIMTTGDVRQADDAEPEWRFTGNAKHDTMLRDEFSYEYAPSVSLCLSILAHHTSTVSCANFLLDHCRKFEALLRPIQPGYPNPEVDYALVTRMLNCLALAAKVSFERV